MATENTEGTKNSEKASALRGFDSFRIIDSHPYEPRPFRSISTQIHDLVYL